MMFDAADGVTIIRTGGRDARGELRPEQRHELPGWWLTRRETDDSAGDTHTTAATARGEFNDEYEALGGLQPTDVIEVDEPLEFKGRWAIKGEVAPFRNPFTGWEAGASVAIERI